MQSFSIQTFIFLNEKVWGGLNTINHWLPRQCLILQQNVWILRHITIKRSHKLEKNLHFCWQAMTWNVGTQFFSATEKQNTVDATSVTRKVRVKKRSNSFYSSAPNEAYIRRTAQLTSGRCIFNIYSTNILTEYFKHDAHSPFFSLQDAVYFIMLSFLFPVIFTF